MAEVAPEIIRTAKFKRVLLQECYEQRRAVKIECDSEQEAKRFQSAILMMLLRARQWPDAARLIGADFSRFITKRIGVTVVVAYLADKVIEDNDLHTDVAQ